MKYSLLILGTIPPPVGGVTIHVKRLLEFLDKNSICYSFLSLKKPLGEILLTVLRYNVVHLHCSNVYFRCILSVFCFLLRKKLIITFHGNIGRYNRLGNILDYISVCLIHIPIVLNESSFEKSIRINKRTRLISSFIPPQQNEVLAESIRVQLNRLRHEYVSLCSTNAFAFALDKDRNEIYGILALIELFKTRSQDCLIISDPSGQYGLHVKNEQINVPSNVIFISYPHSYYALLKEVDCMIRNTTTDGDALSIKEALFIGKFVCATNVVDRHSEVHTYHTLKELNSLLDSVKDYSKEIKDLSGEKELLLLYKELSLYETNYTRS
ncbi:glycosyltransferase family 1 protein [Butyricimonas paravirosa]